jgi:hypothetical protein
MRLANCEIWMPPCLRLRSFVPLRRPTKEGAMWRARFVFWPAPSWTYYDEMSVYSGAYDRHRAISFVPLV